MKKKRNGVKRKNEPNRGRGGFYINIFDGITSGNFIVVSGIKFRR